MLCIHFDPSSYGWNDADNSRENRWKNDRVNQYWQQNIITDGFITAHTIHLLALFAQLNSISSSICAVYCLWSEKPLLNVQCWMWLLHAARTQTMPCSRHKREMWDYWAIGNEPLITNELRAKLSIMYWASIITGIISGRRHFIDNNHHRKNHKLCSHANLIYLSTGRSIEWPSGPLTRCRPMEKKKESLYKVFRLSFHFSLSFGSLFLYVCMSILCWFWRCWRPHISLRLIYCTSENEFLLGI